MSPSFKNSSKDLNFFPSPICAFLFLSIYIICFLNQGLLLNLSSIWLFKVWRKILLFFIFFTNETIRFLGRPTSILFKILFNSSLLTFFRFILSNGPLQPCHLSKFSKPLNKASSAYFWSSGFKVVLIERPLHKVHQIQIYLTSFFLPLQQNMVLKCHLNRRFSDYYFFVCSLSFSAKSR